MKKLLTAALAVVSLATISFAQVTVTVSPELGIPIGDMGDAAKIGGGATIRATYDLSPCVAVGLNSGYIQFGKKNGIETSVVPVEAIATYKFDKMGFTGLYAGVQIGAAYWKQDVDEIQPHSNVTGDWDEWKFSVAPLVGYNYKINDKVSVGGDVRYQYGGETELQSIGMRVGVSYAF